jgi:uncharacterized protein (TIGR03437 family)
MPALSSLKCCFAARRRSQLSVFAGSYGARTLVGTALAFSLLVGGGTALSRAQGSATPPAPVFPASTWQTATPEEVGMDPAKVAQALATLPEPAVVIRRGRIVAAKGDIARPAYIWSASKSLVALAAARLMQQGHITLDTPVPGSDDPTGPPATYRHFLSMTSDFRLSPHAPGEHYAYNNGAVVHYATHLKDAYFPGRDEVRMLRESYLDALGLEDGVGYRALMSGWDGGWSLSTRDLARVGYLVLRDGNWNGEQLLPASFVNALYENQIPAQATEGQRGDPFYNEHPIGTPHLPGAYSFGYWLAHKCSLFGGAPARTEAVGMWGAFGTTVLISREADLVIAAVNTSPHDNLGGLVSGATLDRFAEAVVSPDINPPPSVGPLAVANAASYGPSIAPASIAVAFGTGLATGTYAATAQPLQTSLGGTTVTVGGAAAQLFYVSPTQVNFVVPETVALGSAAVSVSLNGTTVASGTINVTTVAPALFTASADGRGTPAGFSTFDGVNLRLLANPDGTPRPLSPGTEASPKYLELYGTGLRGRTGLGGVQVMVGGVPAQVLHADKHLIFAGLDQLNIKLPPSLVGRGDVEVVVTVDGREANRVTIKVM